ncbi:Lar family restriction alleviation protein [Escherichia coli]|uniref:Lar family restriction alleviation protein n=2 Tax=Enterobacterales TaxID=91347 RepID=UPI00289CBD89|nr:Lar family restriction alleviation protein [Salmonella enterica]
MNLKFGSIASVDKAHQRGNMMRHDNVKPCPFCGCSSIRVREISNNYRACCNSCETSVAFQESEEAAVKRWNSRADEKPSGGHLSV